MPASLEPTHCGWCGGAKRAVLEAMSRGLGPTDAGREAGCSRAAAQRALRGALARGCLSAVPYASMSPEERGRRSREARQAPSALLEEIRVSTDRIYALVAQVRAWREAISVFRVPTGAAGQTPRT